MKKWMARALLLVTLFWSAPVCADQIFAEWMNSKLWGTSQVCGPNAVEGGGEEFQAWLSNWNGGDEEPLKYMNASQYISPPLGRACNFVSAQNPTNWANFASDDDMRFAVDWCRQNGSLYSGNVELIPSGNDESSSEPGLVMRQNDTEIEFYLCDEAQIERAPIKPERLMLFPIDEGLHDEEFERFRQALLEAIQQGDSAAIRAAMSDQVKLSFGGESVEADIEAFLQDQERLEEFEWVLLNGGYWTEKNESYWGSEFQAPFFNDETALAFEAVAWPELASEFDPRAHFVTVDSLDLQSEPSSDSDVVTMLGFEIVLIVEDEYWQKSASDFVQVELSDGKVGYVQMSNLRSVTDYRAIFGFDDISGEWKLLSFLAGD